MEIKPLHTDADYKATLREVSGLIDLAPEPATPEGDASIFQFRYEPEGRLMRGSLVAG